MDADTREGTTGEAVDLGIRQHTNVVATIFTGLLEFNEIGTDGRSEVERHELDPTTVASLMWAEGEDTKRMQTSIDVVQRCIEAQRGPPAGIHSQAMKELKQGFVLFRFRKMLIPLGLPRIDGHS